MDKKRSWTCARLQYMTKAERTANMIGVVLPFLGLIAAVDPRMATGIAGGMTAYLRGIPEELYALFGTGYLGYTAARTWGKLRGVEK